MNTIKIGDFQVPEKLILDYAKLIKAQSESGYNYYERQRTSIHNEILKSVGFERHSYSPEYSKFIIELNQFIGDVIFIPNKITKLITPNRTK